MKVVDHDWPPARKLQCNWYGRCVSVYVEYTLNVWTRNHTHTATNSTNSYCWTVYSTKCYDFYSVVGFASYHVPNEHFLIVYHLPNRIKYILVVFCHTNCELMTHQFMFVACKTVKRHLNFPIAHSAGIGWGGDGKKRSQSSCELPQIQIHSE